MAKEIITICKNSVANGSSWWTEELRNNKSKVNALRRRFQRCDYPCWRLTYQQEYKKALASHKRLVKKTKTEYWSNYFGSVEDWDEAKLKELVEKKHGKNELKMTKTDTICKYFLDALENHEYCWIWRCPNGENKCPDRHVLPPGFVLKKDGNKEEKTKQISIEDLVEKQNVPCLEISSECLSTALNNVEGRAIVSQRQWENNQATEGEMPSEEHKDVALINENLLENLGDLDEELLNFVRGLSSEDMKNLKDFWELINFFRGLSSEDLKKLKDFCREMLNFFRELLDVFRELSSENLKDFIEIINFFRGLSSEDLKNLKDLLCELSHLIKGIS